MSRMTWTQTKSTQAPLDDDLPPPGRESEFEK